MSLSIHIVFTQNARAPTSLDTSGILLVTRHPFEGMGAYLLFKFPSNVKEIVSDNVITGTQQQGSELSLSKMTSRTSSALPTYITCEPSQRLIKLHLLFWFV